MPAPPSVQALPPIPRTTWLQPADSAASTVPSPPSATGCSRTSRPGTAARSPPATAAATPAAPSDPLNLSGATTTCRLTTPLAAPVGAVAVRVDQQRDVVVGGRVGDLADDGDQRVEALGPLGGEPVPGVEGHAVHARAQRPLGDQPRHPAVGVGDAAADRCPAVAAPGLQGDPHAGGRPPAGGV